MSDTAEDPQVPFVRPAVPLPPTSPPAGPMPGPQPYLLIPAGNVMPPPYPAVAAPPSSRGMYTAAAVINWVYLGVIIVFTLGIGVIAAAWFVPMTIRIHRYAKDPYRHTSLGVCTLLFCNIISGILMLADDGGRPSPPLR